MSRPLTPPSAGQPISASFFAELLREIRANRLVNGPGYRLRRTPNGTALDLARAKAAQSGRFPGCFDYAAAGDATAVRYRNPYYMVGSRLYRVPDENLLTGSGELGIDYLEIDLDSGEANVMHAHDFAALQQVAESASRKAIFPLYEFASGGAVKTDLRNIFSLSSWEFNA